MIAPAHALLGARAEALLPTLQRVAGKDAVHLWLHARTNPTH